MKKQLIILSVACLWIGTTLQARVRDILPKPQQITYTECNSFALNQPIQLNLPIIGINDPAINTELTALITQNGGSVVETAEKIIQVNIVPHIPNAEFQPEAYSIEVCSSIINIQATTLRGAYWAIQTLWQMAENNRQTIESTQIVDWAAFRIRGYMHDIGRSYIQFDELKNQIKKLARFKINTFHWHLTDNQGWRLESKVYPQLNANSSFTRMRGQFYTIAQAQELVRFGKQHGVEIIPEIDMPGHSEAFRKAMGHVMLTNEGLRKMRAIMTEVCNTFSQSKWIHIGSDEVREADKTGATISESVFIQQITNHIRQQGKKIVVWNPGHGYNESNIDMTQMWSSRGTTIGNKPTIDSRYHYINHYDQYADIVSLHNSTVAERQKGTSQHAGLIIGVWNDRMLESDRDIVIQNAFYPAMLAAAERAWRGGGKGYFTEIGTTLDPSDMDFIDWEKRFLHHKANFLQNEPIAYVKQTNIHWKITDPFPNGGNINATFPPENNIADTYIHNGNTYQTTAATGAGIYLRHVWGTLIPSFYSNPMANTTAYAYTYVYSPTQQSVGMQIEFQNYGRSEADLPPPKGQWDYNNSKIWVNNTPIAPPTWTNKHNSKNNEITLKNENFSAQNVKPFTLNKGWNKVLIKLPNRGFSIPQVRLVKWMFTFVFTTTDGKSAVEGLVYSPNKNIHPALDLLKVTIDKANAFVKSANIGEEPGYYHFNIIKEFRIAIDKAIETSKNNTLNNHSYEAAAKQLASELKGVRTKICRPNFSNHTKTYWYSLSTPNRENNGNNFVTFKGNNASLKGEIFHKTNENQLWKFTKNSDGTFNIVSKSSTNSHISPNSGHNTALKSQIGSGSDKGWKINPIYTNTYFIIVSNSVQLNQTGSGLKYEIYNWGGGSNITDVGCQYQIKTELVEGETNKDLLQKAINNAYAKILSVTIGEQPGMHSQQTVNNFTKNIDTYKTLLNNSQSNDTDIASAISELQQKTAYFVKNINLPIVSNKSKKYWYSITSINRENKSIRAEGAGIPLLGKNFDTTDDAFLWKVEKNRNGKHVLANKATGNYIDPEANSNTALVTTQNIPNRGWTFTPIGNQWFIITDGTTQLNQTNAGLGYKIYNWGNGTNTTDTGCQFLIRLKKSTSTNVQSTRISTFHIWTSNGYLRANVSLDQLSVRTMTSQQINVYHQLPKGIVLVRTPDNTVRKLIVR